MIIPTSKGEYEIRNEPDIAEVFSKIGSHDLVVTDSNLETCYQSFFDNIEKKIVVQAGESSKSMDCYSQICKVAAQMGIRRSGRIVAIGGGVVGDLAGFVAATYMRGIDLLQIPTSLLAMVDSSVGGKVAIDIPEGKNLIGAFWPPSEVIVCLDFLKTLPREQFVNGMAEVWKYGWIMDESFLENLEAQNMQIESKEFQSVIHHCIELKAKIVSEDEFETTGRRAILNFGHTIGHAIEKCQNYQGVLHGEAVAIGMVVEARLGEILGITPAGVVDRVERGLNSQGLPTTVPNGLSIDELIAAMYSDKKVTKKGLAFSLILNPGRCKLFDGISEEHVRRALQR